MNYEVKPFQDCKSITIDELKSQPSKLLNLAMAERQPLRVSTEDGREFLLFPQEIFAPLCDNDFRLIVLSAMRYAMGRDTYMPLVVTDYIKRHIRLLDGKFLVLATNDIRHHFEDYGEYEPNRRSGRIFWRRLKQSREAESFDQRRKSEPAPYVVCH